MSTKRLTQTRRIELVETHNIAISLDRLTNAPYDGERRMKRAIYHALTMANVLNKSALEQIRIALELP